MTNVQISINVPPVNSEVLVHLKNIESPAPCLHWVKDNKTNCNIFINIFDWMPLQLRRPIMYQYTIVYVKYWNEQKSIQIMLKLSFLFTLVLEKCQHFTNIFYRSLLLPSQSFFVLSFKVTSLVNLYDGYIRHNERQIMQEGSSWSCPYGS